MTDSKKILILYAHPSQHRSEVNQALYLAAQTLECVTAVDLYAEYPTFQIDIDREQQRLIDHDVIIFQFPLYWYSTPSILKEWQDLVLEHNFAYGQQGKALQGKTFLCATTAGAAKATYQSDGFNHFTLRELLRPLEQMASLTGMTYLAPFILFNARTAQEDQRVDQHVDAYLNLLTLLQQGRLDIQQACQLDLLGNDLSALTGQSTCTEDSQ